MSFMSFEALLAFLKYKIVFFFARESFYIYDVSLTFYQLKMQQKIFFHYIKNLGYIINNIFLF